MLNCVLEEDQLGLLAKGHVVIIKVVLENSLYLIHVSKILIQTIFFLCTHLQIYYVMEGRRGNFKFVRYNCVKIANLSKRRLNLTLIKSPNMMGCVTKYEGSKVILKYLPGRKRERESKMVKDNIREMCRIHTVCAF